MLHAQPLSQFLFQLGIGGPLPDAAIAMQSQFVSLERIRQFVSLLLQDHQMTVRALCDERDELGGENH